MRRAARRAKTSSSGSATVAAIDVAGVAAQLLVVPVVDRDADDRGLELARGLEPVERPEGHFLRQVAADPEDRQHAGGGVRVVGGALPIGRRLSLAAEPALSAIGVYGRLMQTRGTTGDRPCSAYSGGVDGTRNRRPRPHGRQHGSPPDAGRPQDRRLRRQPRRGRDAGRRGGRGRLLARGPGGEAERAALGLGDGPGRGDHRADRRGRSPRCSSPATRSSTAATPTTATTSAAPPRSASGGSTTSTAAPAAASSASSAATA